MSRPRALAGVAADRFGRQRPAPPVRQSLVAGVVAVNAVVGEHIPKAERISQPAASSSSSAGLGARRRRRPLPVLRATSVSVTRMTSRLWSMTCVVAFRDPCPRRHERRHLGAALPEFDAAQALDEHRLVLTDWIIDELNEVVGRKRPDLLPALEAFLAGIDYGLASPGDPSVPISDPDDQPILRSCRRRSGRRDRHR